MNELDNIQSNGGLEDSGHGDLRFESFGGVIDVENLEQGSGSHLDY